MNKRPRLQIASLCVAATLAMPAAADWRSGVKVRDIYFGYDGQTTSFTLVGVTKSACTCYPVWPDRMCLQRTRASYKEELATLILAKNTDKTVSVNIDENTCSVIALGLD